MLALAQVQGLGLYVGPQYTLFWARKKQIYALESGLWTIRLTGRMKMIKLKRGVGSVINARYHASKVGDQKEINLRTGFGPVNDSPNRPDKKDKAKDQLDQLSTRAITPARSGAS